MKENNNMENVKKVEGIEVEELRALGLEAYETTTETMLEEMGASFGKNNCCSIVLPL